MSKNAILHAAKRAKNDEFYTQYADIEKEMNSYLEFDENVFKDKTILLPFDDPEWSNFTKYFAQNFERFGLKKLISTSYASASKGDMDFYHPSKFESNDPKYVKEKTKTHGKIFILERDFNGDKKINLNDIEWNYLKGDGDFRSAEIKKLRDMSDIIITNPPFSLFREFLEWIIEANKKFIILGNINSLTHKCVFPLIKTKQTWLGPSITSGDREFMIPSYIVDPKKFTGIIRKDDNGNDEYFQRVVGVRWYTNIDHGRRHQPIPLMSMNDNLKFSKHKIITEQGYQKYDNFDAIEVPFADAIPSDYDGLMGVPISIMDKYCPEQFDILGCSYDYGRPDGWATNINMSVSIKGKNIYKRFLIKHKEPK